MVAAVKAVGDWFLFRDNATLKWKNANGELVVEGINSKNAAELAQLLVRKK